MKRKLIAGNWKMNKNYKESEKLAMELDSNIDNKLKDKLDILICPSFISLGIVNKKIKDSGLRLGAQDLFYEEDGAYTGEVSASMLKSVGCEYVIIGHSERRKIIHETNKIINRKIRKALDSGLKPILCVGESLEEREDEIYEGVVEKQLREGLAEITIDQMKNIVIAYEPVWAIGTGLNATPDQITAMHELIANVISKFYGESTAQELRILYGGSVNAKNARDIFNAGGVDGALIGGASLKADEFSEIVNIASKD